MKILSKESLGVTAAVVLWLWITSSVVFVDVKIHALEMQLTVNSAKAAAQRQDQMNVSMTLLKKQEQINEELTGILKLGEGRQ